MAEIGWSLQNEQGSGVNIWGEQEKERTCKKWSEQEYACTEQDDGN